MNQVELKGCANYSLKPFNSVEKRNRPWIHTDGVQNRNDNNYTGTRNVRQSGDIGSCQNATRQEEVVLITPQHLLGTKVLLRTYITITALPISRVTLIA